MKTPAREPLRVSTRNAGRSQAKLGGRDSIQSARQVHHLMRRGSETRAGERKHLITRLAKVQSVKTVPRQDRIRIANIAGQAPSGTTFPAIHRSHSRKRPG